VDNIDDVVFEDPDNGSDEIIASIDYTLPANVENLTLTGTAIEAEGNDLPNRINGDDVYFGHNIHDQIIGTDDQGTDGIRSLIYFSLYENVENLTLIGAAREGEGNGLTNYIVADDLGNSLYGGGHG